MAVSNIGAAGIATSESGRRQRTRIAFGIALLILELVLFARARFTESRYFCWAPFHSEARYVIDATLGGRALTDDQIARRYRLPRYYWDPGTRSDWELNTITHVIDTIRATEAALPAAERAAVVVTYRVNGRPNERWRSP